MKRRVEQCKGRAFAGAVEGAMHGGAVGARAAPLDVRGRKGSKRPRHLLDAEVGQMPRFQRGKPVGEDSWRRFTHG